MAGIVKDWRIELIDAQRGLFHPPEGHPKQASGYPCCEEGWPELLERMCGRIETALREGESVHSSQVKEKLAGLRVYWRGQVAPGTSAQINEAIALAEAPAACTCEECGAAAHLHSDAGRYQTLREAHAEGAKVPAGPCQETVHSVRVPSPNGFRIAPPRYEPETDRFVDVSPSTRGIEEE